MAVMPVMVAVPMTMPVMVPVAMMVPAYFFRLDAIDVVLRYDGGLSDDGRGSSLQCTRNRGKRRGLCACGEHHTTRYKSNVASFEILRRSMTSVPFLRWRENQQSRRLKINVR